MANDTPDLITEPSAAPEAPEADPITLHTKIDLIDLGDQLVDTCPLDDLFDLIKAIDDRAADLGFTRRLATHFVQVVKENE